MKALVTGAGGFVGRHMARALVKRGYEVFANDLEFRVGTIAHGSTQLLGNINYLFKNQTMVYDLVVHCAYHVGGRVMIDGNALVLAKNMQLDANLFEWAVRTQQKRVLYFSSSAAYPVSLQQENFHMQLVEDDLEWNSPLQNIDLCTTPDGRYGWAKQAGEQLAAAAQQAGLNVHVVRPFSGYGSDQSLDYPFPTFIDRVLRKVDEFEIWGSGKQVRDWIHIDDVVEGALQVVETNTRTPVNLGCGRPTSMYELAERVMQASDHQVPIKVTPNMPMGVMWRVADTQRMNQIYTPQVTLEEGIERALRERAS